MSDAFDLKRKMDSWIRLSVRLTLSLHLKTFESLTDDSLAGVDPDVTGLCPDLSDLQRICLIECYKEDKVDRNERLGMPIKQLSVN